MGSVVRQEDMALIMQEDREKATDVLTSPSFSLRPLSSTDSKLEVVIRVVNCPHNPKRANSQPLLFLRVVFHRLTIFNIIQSHVYLITPVPWPVVEPVLMTLYPDWASPVTSVETVRLCTPYHHHVHSGPWSANAQIDDVITSAGTRICAEHS